MNKSRVRWLSLFLSLVVAVSCITYMASSYKAETLPAKAGNFSYAWGSVSIDALAADGYTVNSDVYSFSAGSEVVPGSSIERTVVLDDSASIITVTNKIKGRNSLSDTGITYIVDLSDDSAADTVNPAVLTALTEHLARLNKYSDAASAATVRIIGRDSEIADIPVTFDSSKTSGEFKSAFYDTENPDCAVLAALSGSSASGTPASSDELSAMLESLGNELTEAPSDRSREVAVVIAANAGDVSAADISVLHTALVPIPASLDGSILTGDLWGKLTSLSPNPWGTDEVISFTDALSGNFAIVSGSEPSVGVVVESSATIPGERPPRPSIALSNTDIVTAQYPLPQIGFYELEMMYNVCGSAGFHPDGSDDDDYYQIGKSLDAEILSSGPSASLFSFSAGDTALSPEARLARPGAAISKEAVSYSSAGGAAASDSNAGGSKMKYIITIKNSGNVDLSNIVLTDDQFFINKFIDASTLNVDLSGAEAYPDSKPEAAPEFIKSSIASMAKMDFGELTLSPGEAITVSYIITIPASLDELSDYKTDNGYVIINCATVTSEDLGDSSAFAQHTIALSNSGSSNGCKVTFNSMGGSDVSAATVQSGTAVAKPADPTKSGFIFSGWYTDTECTAAYDFNSLVTKDIVLYAKWVSLADAHVVTFNSNGGSEVASQAVAPGGLIAEPKDPTKQNYNFAGWYSDAGLTTKWDFAANTVNSDITLYAKWTPAGPKTGDDSASHDIFAGILLVISLAAGVSAALGIVHERRLRKAKASR